MISQEITYRKHNITIERDEHASSPDQWLNEYIFLIYGHRQFSIQRDGFDPKDIFRYTSENKTNLYKGYVAVPVYAYIHSGVSLSLGGGTCSFDTSMQGYVLIKLSEFTIPEKHIQLAESVINEWNMYLDGEIYRWETDFDSCNGYYGDNAENLHHMLSEAKASIDWEISKRFEAHANYLKKTIKAKVNMKYRKSFNYA